LIEPEDMELEANAEHSFRTLKEIRETAEANAIQEALAMSGGQIGKASEMLGVSRPTVYHLLKKYNIEA
jgi:two-component system NtrC family response regulator